MADRKYGPTIQELMPRQITQQPMSAQDARKFRRDRLANLAQYYQSPSEQTPQEQLDKNESLSESNLIKPENSIDVRREALANIARIPSEQGRLSNADIQRWNSNIKQEPLTPEERREKQLDIYANIINQEGPEQAKIKHAFIQDYLNDGNMVTELPENERQQLIGDIHEIADTYLDDKEYDNKFNELIENTKNIQFNK